MPILHSSTVRAFQLAIGASLTGLGISATALSPAWGGTVSDDRILIAQQIVDGLPPPPSFPVADLSDFPAPPDASRVAPSQPLPADQLFMVAVNGNSPLLLEQVRQVQPTALIQEYNGQPIILVGAYETPTLANQQVAALATNGIQSSVTPVPSSIFEPVPLENGGFAGIPELPPADFNTTAQVAPVRPQSASVQPAPTQGGAEFAPVPAPTPTPPVTPTTAQFPTTPQPTAISTQELTDNAYYIVIPGSATTLSDVRAQVVLLGGRHDVVAQRERPLGPHVLVGPFADRRAASRWNGFLRDFGMNARVYYRR